MGTDSDLFIDVEAVTSNDVWAVGYSKSDGPEQPLIEHWDGSKWSATIIPMPNGGTLKRLSVVSSSDIWAVGSRIEIVDGAGYYQTLIMHWDGTDWDIVPSPNVWTKPNGVPTPNELYGVSAVSANDVWAVGLYLDSVQKYTLALHWDGSEWSVVPTPNPGHGPSLSAVAAVASNDVWAVGSTGNRTLVVHWDGNEWSQVASPSPSVDASYLQGIAVGSATNIWTVGYSCCPQRTVILHWDGTAWSISPNPNPGTTGNVFVDVSAASNTDVWAVGRYNYGNIDHVLIERYSDPCVTPTPTAVSTSITTAVATSSPSPSACTLSFSDVPSDHTFYANIRCLACRGIISGYSDGTFRPGNEITRSQIAKMVSNAAGLENEPGAQIFEDVDPTNPFYSWINRLSMKGYMGGYPCGTVPEEPCNPPEDRPYFRPFANATRGQLAKIVANAAGIGGTPTGVFYTDVQGDHPFYTWIMLLTNPGVMSGYQCGGPGEPCDDKNRPYFRPYNNVTRGQASKIVANTFFAGCAAQYP